VTPSRLPRRCHAGNHVYTCLEPRRHDPWWWDVLPWRRAS
jgi:hypothetical protein